MSTDMATKNYASHNDSLGRSSFARMAAFGYTYSPLGENIAGGFSDAQNTFNQWVNACDPDASGSCTYAHRLNMLNAGFRAIGISRAYAAGSTYGWYWVTDFGGSVEQSPAPSPSPTPVSVPVISSFTASPATITAGQGSTLSWSVSGATTVAIEGIGDLTRYNSTPVWPTTTTSYRLTATNSAGSSTAVVTVNVQSTASDSSAPTTPRITDVRALSATEVSLQWDASSDNVGVSGYQVSRNGSVLANVPASVLSYRDANATASTAYTYMVKAYDATGNYSPAAVAQVTTPAAAASNPPSSPAPSSGACPGPQSNAFTACFYGNTDLAGSPALVRTDPAIDFDWSRGFPVPPLSSYNYSVSWRGNFGFENGVYSFRLSSSDGVRLYVDGELVLDRWRDQAAMTWIARVPVSAGNHTITVEHYGRTGMPSIQVSWSKLY
jgi:uncharacterized protein YkwD